MDGELKFASLSEQVYGYLRQQMNYGDLLPGSTINIGEIAKQLGISKTPLKDALIQDVKNAYDSIGLIEAFIVTECIDKIESSHIQRLEELNKKMISDINKNDFSQLFTTNLQFHNVYLDVSENEPLKKFILPIKHRLYDFPRQNYIKEWELRNCEEHNIFINHLQQGSGEEAAKVLKDIHWSFDYQKEFIYTFYEGQYESD
ncbi:MAG: hypothetical protein BA866_12615 [Desulfobulbaceae bacterium S5133MH15]|nr:MAG: hypothetical protein BA866_12615 [Desulfobulbaceae bacterium S5133MH15]